jgi:hypothetical protein
MSGQRIDRLTPGTNVTLGFDHGTEPATFIDFADNEGDPRATFESMDIDTGRTYRWEAYRYNGHWAYGTSADRLRLVGVERP